MSSSTSSAIASTATAKRTNRRRRKPIVPAHPQSSGRASHHTEKLVSEGDHARRSGSHGGQYVDALERNTVVSRPYANVIDNRFLINFEPFRGTTWRAPAETRLDAQRIATLTAAFTQVPEDLTLHRAVSRVIADRKAMGAGEKSCDWGYAETLAYASLLTEQCAVRISGQDSGRGTFFHRHAVIHDQKTGGTYLPLQNLAPDQANFVIN